METHLALSLSFVAGVQLNDLMGYLTHFLWPFPARNGLRFCKGDKKEHVLKFLSKRNISLFRSALKWSFLFAQCSETHRLTAEFNFSFFDLPVLFTKD